MHGLRTVLASLLVACGVGVAAWAAEGAEVRDWGAWRVKVEERFTGPGAGRSWMEEPQAGIGLSRPGRAGEHAILDYKMGWMAEEGQGAGVAGMLEGELGMEERLQVVSFGRRGGEIGLVMVVHPAGGVLPESIKDAVRRKMGAAEGSRAPVSLEDAQAVGLQGKKVAFAGAFPEDLPAGEYQVVAELRSEAGEVKQRYEKRLVKREKEENPLQNLTDEQLLREYVKRGEALRGTGVEPIDFSVGKLAAAFPYDSPPSMAWIATHREIVRRGKQMVPALIEMLEREAVRNPGEATHMTAKFGFAFDVMRMLGEIGDPRPVPLLVRIMEGMDGKANLPVRMQAVETAEWLTYTTFLVEHDNPPTSVAMMHEWTRVRSFQEQTAETREADVKRMAELYAKWLNGEGRDATQWLPLARARARKALEGNDPLAIRNAIAFMTDEYWGPRHDDAPEETMRAIMRTLDRPDKTALAANRYRLPLASALAGYGPAARKYVGYMIEDAKKHTAWNYFRDMTQVGGEKAVTYMVESLPKLRRDVGALGLDVNVDTMQLQAEGHWAVTAYRACRWGIERWAGRVFETDEEIAAWWEKAKDKSQQQWLEESLGRTSVEADRGSAKAQYILRCMVPELPNAEYDKAFRPPWYGQESMPYREKAPGVYSEKWVKENRGRLVYDERRSCFVVGR